MCRKGSSFDLRLQNAQHFGLTFQNMNSAFDFYTEVSGGTEVTHVADFHEEAMHNTLPTGEEARALGQGVASVTAGVPTTVSGSQPSTSAPCSSTTW